MCTAVHTFFYAEEERARKGKTNDPGRRSRILRATLEVIRADGVPMGSVTYYFPSLEGLIVSALDTTRSELEPGYAAPLRNARTNADVVEALVAATIGETSPSLLDIRLYEEIRHCGARNQKLE